MNSEVIKAKSLLLDGSCLKCIYYKRNEIKCSLSKHLRNKIISEHICQDYFDRNTDITADQAQIVLSKVLKIKLKHN
jgi:hypothetical protein